VSASIDPTTLLRPGLLEGISVLLAGIGDAPVSAIGPALSELGANVSEWPPATAESSLPDGDALVQDVDLLVVDSAAMFAHCIAHGEGDGLRGALRECLDGSWGVTQAVATAAFVQPSRAGRIIYLAPAPDAGEYAQAACAGLENLARTLSIEWARYGITTVTIAEGEATTTGEVAALTAYLASPAGAFFSGCLLDLRGV
jgi:NAD(P)-dependent dehydrogenase (short-subunit alcohol dehydrogenase family)